jgi:hypothetical protein
VQLTKESVLAGFVRSLSSDADKVRLSDMTMETSPTENRGFFVLRRQGAQSKFDIAAFASDLANLQTGDAPLRILFDWLKVDSWPFEAPSAAAVQVWNKTAPAIKRAAFVHDHKWNRHAAMLAALMRVSNAEARSFRPPNADRAIAWLEGQQEIILH